MIMKLIKGMIAFVEVIYNLISQRKETRSLNIKLISTWNAFSSRLLILLTYKASVF